MPQEMMQHETRQEYTYVDQHGRPYWCIVDVRARPRIAPCCPIQPKGWTAPIMPDLDLVRPDETKLGTLQIDYPKWIERTEADNIAFARSRAQVAERMFGDEATAAIARNDPRLQHEVGTPPLSVDFVRAAAGGKSPWVLGLAPVENVPAWAVPILLTLPQYRKAEAIERRQTEFVDDPDGAEPVPVGVAASGFDAMFSDAPTLPAGRKR